MGDGGTEEFAAQVGEMRYEKFVSVELDRAHLPAWPHPQSLAPEAVDCATDKGGDCKNYPGIVSVHAPDLDRAVVVQADGIPRSSVQLTPWRREEVTIHPCSIHRRQPGPVPHVLLIDEILRAGRVSAQGTDFVQVGVQAVQTQHSSVADRPGGEIARPSLVAG